MHDGDGYCDEEDVSVNETEWADTDGDGIGDNSDPDADGDGICDNDEDGDGYCDMYFLMIQMNGRIQMVMV